MSFSIPGLGGPSNQPNDTGLFVQQLLDQVQNGISTPAPPQQPIQPDTPQEHTPSAPQYPLNPEPQDEKSDVAIENGQHVIDVPQCLIFGGETGEDEFLIPARCLQKLPTEVLVNLLRDGERMGSFHRLGSIPHWESMVRLNQYLDHGDYKPSKPAVPIEWLDQNGTAHVWNNRDSPNTVEVPRATMDLFLREIDFYIFAAKVGYTELRRVSAERICNRYPKSAESIIALIEKAGPCAAQNEDRGLIQRIVNYINANCRELTAMPGGQFLTLLRKMTKGKPPFGPVMLEAYFSAGEAVRRELTLKTTATPSAAVIRTPTENLPPTTPASGINMTSPSYTSAEVTSRPPPAFPANFNSPFSPFEIPSLIEALERGCLVVANDNGYGTLVRDGQRKTRNTDFTFKKGELLVADRFADTVNGRHNMLVMNSKGELGDILRTLVKKVLPGMGVLAADNSVNDGRSPRMAEQRPDREERKFGPFPTPPNYRARSRSPGPVGGGGGAPGPGSRPSNGPPRRSWPSHHGPR